MSNDNFAGAADSLIAPAAHCFPIVPVDGTDLPNATKALYIGGEGDVALIPVRGENAVVFRNLGAGTILDVRVRAVLATGTTATDMVGLA